MHRIFTIPEVVQTIVVEYAALHGNTWTPGGNNYRRDLLLLATTARVFSTFALEILWRDASLARLLSLFDRTIPVTEDQTKFLESRSCIRSIRVVLPTFAIDQQSGAMFESLQTSQAFLPVAMYCVPSTDPNAQEIFMERYGMLFKESLRDILLYVAVDQSFKWGRLLPCLPSSLRKISILPMLPTSKAADSPPGLSFYDTRRLLAAFTMRAETLRTVELRFLHLGTTKMVLEHLKLLPRLSTLLLASPRLYIEAEDEDEDEDEPLTTGNNISTERWPSLEVLIIRGYLLDTAGAILGACQSTSLTSLTIKTPLDFGPIPLSHICEILAQKWTDSLEALEFEGRTALTDDPLIDAEGIVQSLTSLIRLKKLYIDCRHVIAHLHRQHLISIGSQMRHLELIHLTSETDSTSYSSNLKLFDLAVLSSLPELLTVTIEIGQTGETISPEDEQHPYSPQNLAASKVNSICVLSPCYDVLAFGQCINLFPKVTVKHRYAPYVMVDLV